MEAWRKELYHHGILGQKWGQRNGPPYPLSASKHSARERKAGYTKSLGGGRNEKLYGRLSGSSAPSNKSGSGNNKKKVPKTSNDRDRYEAAKKYFLDEDYDMDKDEVWSKRDADLMKRLDKINEIEPEDYFDKDGNLTEEARKWRDKYIEWEKDWNKYKKDHQKAYLKERERRQKDVFFNKETASDMRRAHKMKNKLISIEADTIGEDSEYFNKAYKEYASANGGPDKWWLKNQFTYEEWREGRPAYDAAKKEYDKRAKDLDKEYKSLVTNIGEKAIGPYLNTPTNKLGFIDTDDVKREIEYILSRM